MAWGSARASRVLLLSASLLLGGAQAQASAAGTLDTLARQLEERLARVLGPEPPGAIDLGLALQPAGGLSLRLQQTVRDLLLSRLVARGFRTVRLLPQLPQSAALQQLAARQGFEYVLELGLKIVEGHLHLRGVLHRTDRDLWRDIRQPERGLRSHLHAVVRQDAEVRAYLGEQGAVPLRFAPKHQRLPGSPVLAAAIGDLDGDGASELVLLRERVIQVLAYRPAAQGFKLRWSFELQGPLATNRARRGLGQLVVGKLGHEGKDQIWARTNQQQQGVWLALEGDKLVLQRQLDGYPLALLQGEREHQLLSAQALPGQDQLSVAALTLGPGAPVPAWLQTLPQTFYALAATTLIDPKGKRQLLGVVDASGQLALFAAGKPLALKGWPLLGSALDLADLDDDGTVELLVSGADDPTRPDQLVVYRLAPDLTPLELWRSGALNGRVVDLAHGDLDGDGRLEAIGIVSLPGGESELMVLN